jgi:cytochrome b6-f complex iron-sulfur subunit
MDQKTSSLKDRRRFLSICLGFLGSVFAGGIIHAVLSYLQPPRKSKKGEVVKIHKDELPPGGMKRFHIRGIPAVVINSKEGFAAFSLVCSHLGCLVKWEGAKNEFICPCHGAKFSAKGEVISGPPPTGLEAFHVEDKEKEVWIS